MASVWAELKRRNVVKVAVAYAIVGWILVEVASVLLPTFQAPEWVMRVFSFFIIAGFPVALVLSWAYELTPEGIKPAHEVDPAESITHITGRKFDFLIIGLLVLAVGFLLINDYLPQDSDPEEVVQEEPIDVQPAPESPVPVVQEEERDVLPNSVAVLPFENLSLDPEDAFFAAGIHDEILNHLVKLSELNVIARTSVMQYASTEKTIPEIADELNVETVMEGTVRYADDRVRITSQPEKTRIEGRHFSALALARVLARSTPHLCVLVLSRKLCIA